MALNPQILIWAREAAGLSVDEAAYALGFKDGQERTGAERLEAMEAGAEEPSRSVLLNMARVYHRSLLVFYLSEPPHTGDRGQDFRRAPGANPTEYDPTLDALIRNIRGRQNIVRDLLEQADHRRVNYIASVTMDVSPVELSRRIAAGIGFSLDEFRRQANIQGAFSYLREKVEASGVFVLLLGNLGSHHTNIPSGVFRGYAIADRLLLLSWSMTRMRRSHGHLRPCTNCRICGLAQPREWGNADAQIEVYCNSVAGEILLPEAEMAELRFLRRAPLDETVGAIARFASSRKISRAMVAYKLFRVNIISQTRWRELDKHYSDEWNAAQANPVSKEKKEGGPSYYVVKRHRLGHAVLDLVKNSLAEGSLTYTRAGQVLGVKPRNVDPLIYTTGMRGGR